MGARRGEHVVSTQEPPNTPPAVDQAIENTRQRIENGVDVIDGLRRGVMKARKALAEAKAHAYVDSEGTIPERNAQVVLATADEVEALDAAIAAYEYAKDLQKRLSKDLDAYRSIGASVREAYRFTGGSGGA
jgi:hypothetical protein